MSSFFHFFERERERERERVETYLQLLIFLRVGDGMLDIFDFFENWFLTNLERFLDLFVGLLLKLLKRNFFKCGVLWRCFRGFACVVV